MEFGTLYRNDFEYMISQFDIRKFEGSNWLIA